MRKPWTLALEELLIPTVTVAPAPSRLGFKDPDNGEWDSQVIIDGKVYRERAEVLILKDDTVWLRKYDDGRYQIPGGGTDPKQTMEESAIREAQEEIQITPKNLKYYGYYLDRLFYKWDQKRGYYGSISHYFVGTYDKPFDESKIKDQDKEPEMTQEGRFWPIDEAQSFLRIEHLEAIRKYQASMQLK